MLDNMARQVIGQGTTRWSGMAGCVGWFSGRGVSFLRALLLLQVLQRQFQLGDRRVQLLRRTAELHATKLGQLRPELLDAGCLAVPRGLLAQDRRRLRRNQRAHLIGQNGQVDGHAASCRDKWGKYRLGYVLPGHLRLPTAGGHAPVDAL